MTAKEYLNQLKKLNCCIKNKKQELSELSEIIYTTPALDTSKEKVTTSVQNKGFDKIDNKIDLEKEIAQQIEDFISLKHKIINDIHSLNRSEYIDILYKRYVQFKSFEEIAVEMNYSYRHTTRIHGYALKSFADMVLNGKDVLKCP